MIIKQLILENIRSHESTEIEFAEGKTLIRGDIGSGKSSIMMSIEAALFGIDCNPALKISASKAESLKAKDIIPAVNGPKLIPNTTGKP